MQKILFALLMAVAKWLLRIAGVERWLMLAGLALAAVFFLVPVLIVLTVAAIGTAIYLFVQNRKKAEQLREAQRKEDESGDLD